MKPHELASLLNGLTVEQAQKKLSDPLLNAHGLTVIFSHPGEAFERKPVSYEYVHFECAGNGEPPRHGVVYSTADAVLARTEANKLIPDLVGALSGEMILD